MDYLALRQQTVKTLKELAKDTSGDHIVDLLLAPFTRVLDILDAYCIGEAAKAVASEEAQYEANG